MQILNCESNQLTYLEVASQDLKELYCNFNSLTKLINLSSQLEKLNCSVNELTILDNLPVTLTKLCCGFNRIEELNNLPSNITVSHLNINDNTVAGLKLNNRTDVFSVQYHPEASPGPHDSDYLFDRFIKLILGV